MSFNPQDSLTLFVVLPALAGLAIIGGGGLARLIFQVWPAKVGSSREIEAKVAGGSARVRWVTLRYGLVALLFWVALSVFLCLDLLGSVSLYWPLVALYSAGWVLVGALLLFDRPARIKWLIFGLFAVMIFGVRFVNWNSRKPFLKDFHRIGEGMTVAQVRGIMGDYPDGMGNPLVSVDQKASFDERGEIVDGGMTFRHTEEGWGNSDWGVVVFANGRVVETRFLLD